MNKHVETAAKAYYNLFPNGYRKWEYISTANDAERESVFYPDSWEEASDRHERCAKTVLPIIKAFLESFNMQERQYFMKEIINECENELKDVIPYGD